MITIQDILQAKSQKEVCELLVPLQLPDGISKNKLSEAIWKSKQKIATPEELALVKLTLSKPIALKASRKPDDVDQADGQSLEKATSTATEPAQESVELATESVQEPVKASEPGNETGVTEEAPEELPEAQDPQADWLARAKATIGGPLPPSIPRKNYERNVSQLNIDNVGSLHISTINQVNEVIQYQEEKAKEEPTPRQGWVDWSNEWKEWSWEPTQQPTTESEYFEKIEPLLISSLRGKDSKTDQERAKLSWHRAVSRTYWLKGEYHYLNDDMRWGAYKKEDLLTILSLSDFLRPVNPILDRKEAAAWKNLKFEAFKARIMTKNNVRSAVEFAGHPRGVLEEKNQRYLITYGPEIITPMPGDCSTIKDILLDLLGEEQYLYFKGWLKTSYEALRDGEMSTGQMLVLAGPPGIGKSFVKEFIIRPILGGRHTDPTKYLHGKTNFNADTSRAESWEIDDMVGFSDSEKRKMMTGAIKKMTASNDHRMEAKYQDAFQPPSLFHRLSMYCNDGPNDLWILPEMNDSTVDKSIILKVTRAVDPRVKLPGNSKKERAAFRDQFKKELPAFIQQELLDWEIPEELKNGRYGIKAYQHPELAKAIHRMSDEGRLLEMMETMLPQDERWLGTSAELETELRTLAEQWKLTRKLEKLLWHDRVIGNCLKELKKKFPERVGIEKKNWKGHNVWYVEPCGTKEGEEKPARKTGTSYRR